MFDEHNTKNWQQDGCGVFLLQECNPPSYRGGKPVCENGFSISVQSKGRSNREGEVEIAKQICDALNGKVWQTERPTAGKWWIAIAPNWRHLFGGWLFRVTVTKTELVRFGSGRTFRFECEGLTDARWLSRELPADPFAVEVE
jgi:hypothetical protein